MFFNVRPFDLQLGVQIFYELYHPKFKTEGKYLKKIECVPVDAEFEIEYGLHGNNYNGTAFLFYFQLETKPQHFCLGDSCSTGCKIEFYRK